MNIVTIGRGNVGSGLATLWTAAGHDVTMLGRDGGDASNADVRLVALPGSAIAEALGKVDGLTGKIAIDATHIYAEVDAHEGRPMDVPVRVLRVACQRGEFDDGLLERLAQRGRCGAGAFV